MEVVGGSEGGQTPARVISPIKIDGVPTLEKNRRSLPTARTPCSISGSVEAMVISRSGSPNEPSASIRRPVAPTLNSPLIGFAPECTPLTSMISTPPPASARRASNDRSPARRALVTAALGVTRRALTAPGAPGRIGGVQEPVEHARGEQLRPAARDT